MDIDDITIIDKEIEKLINDKNKYDFNSLKEKVEAILKDREIFLLEGEINSKAVDMYLKTVITQRNKIKQEQEETTIKKEKKEKYILIEEICKSLEFKSQEELIKQIEELEKMSVFELVEIKKGVEQKSNS